MLYRASTDKASFSGLTVFIPKNVWNFTGKKLVATGRDLEELPNASDAWASSVWETEGSYSPLHEIVETLIRSADGWFPVLSGSQTRQVTSLITIKLTVFVYAFSASFLSSVSHGPALRSG